MAKSKQTVTKSALRHVAKEVADDEVRVVLKGPAAAALNQISKITGTKATKLANDFFESLFAQDNVITLDVGNADSDLQFKCISENKYDNVKQLVEAFEIEYSVDNKTTKEKTNNNTEKSIKSQKPKRGLKEEQIDLLEEETESKFEDF